VRSNARADHPVARHAAARGGWSTMSLELTALPHPRILTSLRSTRNPPAGDGTTGARRRSLIGAGAITHD
jgi:hypothetical protein